MTNQIRPGQKVKPKSFPKWPLKLKRCGRVVNDLSESDGYNLETRFNATLWRFSMKLISGLVSEKNIAKSKRRENGKLYWNEKKSTPLTKKKGFEFIGSCFLSLRRELVSVLSLAANSPAYLDRI